jgi:hypothetical protein
MTDIETIDATELQDSELEEVTGGGLLKFLKAIVYPGRPETDSNLATNTQVWVTSIS